VICLMVLLIKLHFSCIKFSKCLQNHENPEKRKWIQKRNNTNPTHIKDTGMRYTKTMT
jgi:hypothetical protein